MSSRFARLAAVLVCAAIVTVVAVVLSSSSSSKPDPASATVAAPDASLLAGIPERRGVLGDPDAPATLTEFVDPQCPICAAAARDVLPTLIRDYVRPGKVKLDARVLSFLGPDSVTAARHAAGARAQNRLWPFLETFYANQGEENSGYATPAFLRRVARAAGVEPGVPVGADAEVQAATAEAERLGVSGTPTFVLTRSGGTPKIIDPADLEGAL